MVPRHRRHQLGVKSPRRSLAVLLFVVSSIAGCASGPNYGEVKSATPSLAQDKARIVFFRQSRFAASVATLRLQIDGVTVGSLPNGSILSVDHATGNLNIRFERKGLLGFGHV